jgi:hypothetical protein
MADVVAAAAEPDELDDIDKVSLVINTNSVSLFFY